ncbi:MAG: hypothetical protein ACRDZZ_14940 [Ilumatobacteraceae bacterium]
MSGPGALDPGDRRQRRQGVAGCHRLVLRAGRKVHPPLDEHELVVELVHLVVGPVTELDVLVVGEPHERDPLHRPPATVAVVDHERVAAEVLHRVGAADRDVVTIVTGDLR